MAQAWQCNKCRGVYQGAAAALHPTKHRCGQQTGLACKVCRRLSDRPPAAAWAGRRSAQQRFQGRKEGAQRTTLAATSLKVSTLNVNRGRKVEQVSQILLEANTDIVCLQDVDINEASKFCYSKAWKRKGFETVLGGFDGMYRTAIHPRWPIRPVQFPTVLRQSRISAQGR